MKKIYLSAVALLLGTTLNAQDAFWTETKYRGAFDITDNTAKTDWTSGWANFDPENEVYGTATNTVSTHVTTNTTWSGIILLKNKVYVQNGVTLTIAPGTIIRGDKLTQGSLIISRGAKIIADGSIDKPIVFTSNEKVGDRNEGDWGGLILLGKAKNNQPNGEALIEGVAESNGTDSKHGGSDDADNSGILRYVRVEFAGIALQPTKEINGVTFGSVGAKTVVDYVQVSFSGDDSFEWFGGAVDCKHLIAYRGIDDDFDTDFGYRGRVQFGLIVRDPEMSDAAGASNGFESDNDGKGSSLKPLTAAVFSNITMVGPKGDGTVTLPLNEKFDKAFCIRKNSSISVFNSVSTGWKKGLSMEGTSVEDNLTGDSLAITNNSFVNYATKTSVTSTTPGFFQPWFGPSNNDTTLTITDVKWADIFKGLGTKIDARLTAGSVIATTADFTHKKFKEKGLSISEITDLVSEAKIYPNPMNVNGLISFNLPTISELTITLFDVTGKVISTIADGLFEAGKNNVAINTSSLENGMYLVAISNGSSIQTIRLSIEK